MRKFLNRLAELPLPQPGGPALRLANIQGGMRGLVLAGLAQSCGGPLLAVVAHEKEEPALIRDFRFFERFLFLLFSFFIQNGFNFTPMSG